VVNDGLRHGGSGVDGLVNGGQGSGDGFVADGSVADGSVTGTGQEMGGSGTAQGDEN
jgi:hypothetical protein